MAGGRVKVKRRNRFAIPTRIEGSRRVAVGFPRGNGETDVIARAIWTHYGTERGIPARPFLLQAMRTNRKKYLTLMRSTAAAILKGESSINVTLRRLGVVAQGDVQVSITNLREPPNAEKTIAAKGSSNPLIDTGEMRSSVAWTVL